MTLHFKKDDLFEAQVQAIGHGVNCRGIMGAGIALEFKRRWPEMYEQYNRRCQSNMLIPGGLHIWWAEDRLIYNLATQPNVNGRLGPATLDALGTALHMMMNHAENYHVTSIGLPRIGAGLGGLEWRNVEEILTDVAHVYPNTDITIYSL